MYPSLTENHAKSVLPLFDEKHSESGVSVGDRYVRAVSTEPP